MNEPVTDASRFDQLLSHLGKYRAGISKAELALEVGKLQDDDGSGGSPEERDVIQRHWEVGGDLLAMRVP